MVLTKLLLFLVLGCAKGYELCNDINDCESCNSMAFCHWCATGSNIQVIFVLNINLLLFFITLNSTNPFFPLLRCLAFNIQ